jgi:hypothetical protein
MRHTDIKRNINLTYFSNMLSQWTPRDEERQRERDTQ